MGDEAAAGLDFAGPVCGAAGRRDGAAADLRDGDSARRAEGTRAVARDALIGGAVCFDSDDDAPD